MPLRGWSLVPIVSHVEDWTASLPVARYLVRQPVGAEHDVDVVPGLRHDMVQSFDVVVLQAASTQLYTIVVAMVPTLSEHDRAVIVRALLATRRPEVVFLIEASPGSAAAEYAGSADSPATAVAVSVVSASLGWNTGNPTAVDVNGRRWTVTAKLDGQRWHCRTQ